MREKRGQVLGLAGGGFDVAGDRCVALPAEGARDGRVGNLSDEDVLELVLHVTADTARRNTPNEVPHLERGKGIVEVAMATKIDQHAAPKRAADHGSVQDDRASRAR